MLPISLQADDFRNDFDPDGKFSQYKVFCFVKGIELDKSGLLSQPGMPNRIMNLISGVLQNRGMNEVPIDQKFDLAVRYWVARQQKTEVQDLAPTILTGARGAVTRFSGTGRGRSTTTIS